MLCSGADAVGTVAEVRNIEIALEDFILGQFVLERHCIPGLAQLAGKRRCSGECSPGFGLSALDQNVLDVLLGQRRSTLTAAISTRVVQQCADGANQVDTVMLIEPRI